MAKWGEVTAPDNYHRDQGQEQQYELNGHELVAPFRKLGLHVLVLSVAWKFLDRGKPSLDAGGVVKVAQFEEQGVNCLMGGKV